jgi:hypothetical protein
VIPKWEKSAFELTVGKLTPFRSVNEFGRWLELGFVRTAAPILALPRSAGRRRAQSMQVRWTIPQCANVSAMNSTTSSCVPIRTGPAFHKALNAIKIIYRPESFIEDGLD